MFNFRQARENMVDCQIHTAGIIVPGILEAFQNTPREMFVPKNYQEVAYSDQDLPIGKGRFLLDPITHARMVQAANLKASDIVLDIGCGTGYSSAILSPMVTTIVALEEDTGYLEKATSLWQQLSLCNIAGVQGRLSEGYPASAPYSVIFINGAVAEIPDRIAGQLAPGGRMITILRDPGTVMGKAVMVESLDGKRTSSTPLFDAGFAWLPGFEPKPAFHF